MYWYNRPVAGGMPLYVLVALGLLIVDYLILVSTVLSLFLSCIPACHRPPAHTHN